MYTFAKVCCLCLNNKCSLINFEECDLDDISTYDKLNRVIPELVSKTDKLPPWICLKCKEELDNTYIFHKKCHKALHLLQLYNEKLQSVNNNSKLLQSQQNSYSLKIKISTKNPLFIKVPDKNITRKCLLEKENNLEFTQIKRETSDANKKTDPENEETSDAVKEELFTEDTFLFDKHIAGISSLGKENNLEFTPIKKETSDVDKETSDADKQISSTDKENSEGVKEEHNLFEEDTLPFEESSSGSNISIVKNEINSNIFIKNEEKRHFDIFCNSNKSVLESVVQAKSDLFTSKSDSQGILEENSDKNSFEFEQNSSTLNKQTNEEDLSLRSRRRTKPVYYNESENESRNFNDDSDFEPDLNIIDDNLSDTSVSAKKLKTNNSSLRPQTTINHVDTSDKNKINMFSYFNNGITHNFVPQPTQHLESARFNDENRLGTPAPAVVIHHLPSSTSSSTNILPQTENNLNVTQRNVPLNSGPSVVEENVLPVLPQPENSNTSLTTSANNSEATKITKKVKTFRRKYVCNICRNKFKSSVELKEHVASHEKVFKCILCFKLCANNNDLEQHLIEHQKQILTVAPPIANFDKTKLLNIFPSTLPHPPSITTNNTNYNIREIIEINSDDDDDYYMEKFFCNICNKKFKDFSKHMVIHQNENKAICVYCKTTFPIKNQLFQHLRDVHCANDPICQLCNETFKNIDLLFLHMYSHYGTDVHKCPECEQLFLQANLMYQHMETVHNCTEFKCFKCNETFESCKLVSYHIFHHSSTSSTLCYYCGKGFKSRRRLQLHMNNLHAPSETYMCKECGKQCPSMNRLKDHIDLCHMDNTYQCHNCSKHFNTKLALYLHRNTHAEQKKRFVCKECGKKFRFRFLLKNHERIHTGEKPFECKTCGKKFTQEVSLVVHNRIHTGEKPYSCEHCGKRYTQSYVYKMHLKKHHSDTIENQNKKSSKEKK